MCIRDYTLWPGSSSKLTEDTVEERGESHTLAPSRYEERSILVFRRLKQIYSGV